MYGDGFPVREQRCLPEGFKLYGDGFPVREQRCVAVRFKIAREGQEEIL